MQDWAKRGVMYQIYPRSYQDSNGDGIGDLKGITSRLDYLADLGVDIIWFSPIFSSPNYDNGYDISDYRNIMQEMGTMADFDELLSEAHKRNIKVLLDVVLNHTSSEHEWFKQSKSSTDNPYRDYYFWKPEKDGAPPNNWISIFEGSVWEKDDITDEYYLHYFVKQQPDLNWENPKVREELVAALRFWLDKGVDGFRLDVIPLISKNIDFPDSDSQNIGHLITTHYANGPRLHEYLHFLHDRVWKDYNCFTVGEGVGVPIDEIKNYVSADRKELDTIYHFAHFEVDTGTGGKFDCIPVDYEKFISIFYAWDQALGDDGWGIVYLGNHDLGRMTSRFGSKKYVAESAKLLNSIILTMRGTPIIYMGDEIGMTNNQYSDITEFNDVQTLNSYKVHIYQGGTVDDFIEAANIQSRDHARTPMPWTDETHGGFTAGTPWLALNPQKSTINVRQQLQDDHSVYHFVKALIRLRKENEALAIGQIRPILDTPPRVMQFIRVHGEERLWVIHNLSDESVEVQSELLNENAELLLSNQEIMNDADSLYCKPWQTAIFKI